MNSDNYSLAECLFISYVHGQPNNNIFETTNAVLIVKEDAGTMFYDRLSARFSVS